MASERVRQMVKKLTEDPEYQHPRNLPSTFTQEAAALSDEEAMDLAARLFMMDEWRYIWSAVVIFKKHPTARTKINWKYLELLGNRMDSWGRRAALVCTVFLNRKAQGGTGDSPRTLMVCEVLVRDRDDMVVKGMSWALRDLLKRDRQAVERFLQEHESELASRVKREVRCKLTTGRKNPPLKKK